MPARTEERPSPKADAAEPGSRADAQFDAIQTQIDLIREEFALFRAEESQRETRMIRWMIAIACFGIVITTINMLLG